MSNSFSLENKIILITGASSGIGRQCAIASSNMGATVILVARNSQKLQCTLENMSPGNHVYYSQDITEYNKIETIISDSVEKLGKISGFVHAAGRELTLPLKSTSISSFEELYSLNCISGFEFVKILVKKKYSKSASFVFVSSIAGHIGDNALSAYSASKGSLISATRSLAIELAPRGYRVNSISPGFIKDTSMSKEKLIKIGEEAMMHIEQKYPLGLGETTDVANACIYLLSDAAKWVSGINLVVDGGYSAQ